MKSKEVVLTSKSGSREGFERSRWSRLVVRVRLSVGEVIKGGRRCSGKLEGRNERETDTWEREEEERRF